MINLKDFAIVFAIGVVALGLAVAFVALFGSGCRAALVEPPFTETVAANVRDR